jgi:hypothetical protein
VPVLNRIPLFQAALAVAGHCKSLDELFLQATNKVRHSGPRGQQAWKPHTVATPNINMASLDNVLGLFAAPRKYQHQKQPPLRSNGNGTIGLEDFAQLGRGEEGLARETLPASPPGSLGRTLDGDLFILVRVRVELINLFFVVAGLGEGIDGVGRRKGCVLVGVVRHCSSFRARRGEGGGDREGDVAVRSTDHRRGDLSSFLPLTRGNSATRSTPTSTSQTRRFGFSFYCE